MQCQYYDFNFKVAGHYSQHLRLRHPNEKKTFLNTYNVANFEVLDLNKPAPVAKVEVQYSHGLVAKRHKLLAYAIFVTVSTPLS